jgi:pimeloyl-ACP methyl ester carboxylesterase
MSVKTTLKQALLDGATLTYLEQGQGVPVVFVHVAVADRRVWEAQREAVSNRYRYIALDRQRPSRPTDPCCLITIPDARHWAPVQNTPAFNAALLTHLEGR